MLRMGIVGTNVISDWFVGACGRSAGRVTAAAVCSRQRGRAEEFAARTGVQQAFDDLATMIEAVDAVYIASPVSAHHRQAMQAIEAGRHVLVEKTMGASAQEVNEILDAAERHEVVAMEAVRNLHTPAHRLIADALPRLGQVRHARFEKLQYSSRYDRFRAGELPNAFDPSLGNSALADIGVYCLQPALDLFGQPARVSGASVWLANGFEGAGTMLLDYGSSVVDVRWSKITAGFVPSAIEGEDASLIIDDLAEPGRIVVRERGGREVVLLDRPTDAAATMDHELLSFAEQVESGVTDPRWSQVSLASRVLMDEHLAR